MTRDRNQSLVPAHFDPELYRSAYPDVDLSGIDPRTHFERYGRLMNRDPAPVAGASGSEQGKHGVGPAELERRYAFGPIQSSAPMRHPELVSIIVPSHNNERFLDRALNAALSQRGVRVEVIVVDDGSTDGSVALARRIAGGAPNLRVISLLRNFGCYYARNVGLMNAQGEFVTIADSDDIMSPDRIARQLDSLKSQPPHKRAIA